MLLCAKNMQHTLILLLSIIHWIYADVMVYLQKSHRQIEVEFRDLSSSFGGAIPVKGIRAFVVYASPENGCSSLAPPPSSNITNFTGHWAVLMRRYDCSFEKKVREAQKANYDIAIVHNVNSSELERMQAENSDGITIPSIFVGSTTGNLIRENYQYDKGYYIIIDDEDEGPFDLAHLMIPFAVVVAICFITMIAFMVMKCIKDRRRARRHRLPNSSLKKIPTTKYRKNDPYETCAICLDDYVEGEKLRILPCSHGYHSKCIDPWLTRNKRVCPMCKRRVFAEDERIPSDTDTETDDDDNTPLLRAAVNTTRGGTFDTQFTEHLRRTFLSHYFSAMQRQHSVSSLSTGSGVGTLEEGFAQRGPFNPGTSPNSSTSSSDRSFYVDPVIVQPDGYSIQTESSPVINHVEQEAETSNCHIA